MKINVNVLCFLLISLTSLDSFAEEQWVQLQPSIRNTLLSGFTRAESRMPLTAEISGKVEKVVARSGEAIPESGNFACLNDTFIRLEIKSVKNDISQHGVDINYYKKEVERHKKLVKRQISAVNILDGLNRDLSNSRLALAKAKITQERLQERKSRHCIKAPAGWLVIENNIEPGQWINQGDVLAEVGNYSELKVPLSLTFKELEALQRSKENINLYFPEKNLSIAAKIDNISPAYDEQTKKIRVDLGLKEKKTDYRGGMRAELKLAVEGSDNVFIIDRKAIEERYEQYYLQRKDGERIRVKRLNELDNNLVRISSPELKSGDTFKVF